MKVIRCHHGQPAQYCQICLTNNTPPPGWGFDWSRCSTCQRSKTLHDVCESKVSPEHRHRQTPYLRLLRASEAAEQAAPPLLDL